MSPHQVKRNGFSFRQLFRGMQPAIALLSVAILIGIPMWLVIVTSGKSQGEALNPDMSLPSKWQFFENYKEAFSDGDIPAALWGSLIIVIPTVLILLILGSMASWILARRSGRAVAVLYALAISGIVLPPAVVTVVLLLRQMGLAGTVIGMICVYMGMYMSTVIFFVTGFIRTIPVQLEEAARVDGAGPFKVF